VADLLNNLQPINIHFEIYIPPTQPYWAALWTQRVLCVTRVTQQTANHKGRSRTATSRSQQQVKSARKVDPQLPLGLEHATFGMHTWLSQVPRPFLMRHVLPSSSVFSPSALASIVPSLTSLSGAL
jgi:hypothetical protein